MVSNRVYRDPLAFKEINILLIEALKNFILSMRDLKSVVCFCIGRGVVPGEFVHTWLCSRATDVNQGSLPTVLEGAYLMV